MSKTDDATLIEATQAGIRKSVNEWLERGAETVKDWLESQLRMLRSQLEVAPLARELIAQAQKPPAFVQVGEFRFPDRSPGDDRPEDFVVREFAVSRPSQIGYSYSMTRVDLFPFGEATPHDIVRALSGNRGLEPGKQYRFVIMAFEKPAAPKEG